MLHVPCRTQANDRAKKVQFRNSPRIVFGELIRYSSWWAPFNGVASFMPQLAKGFANQFASSLLASLLCGLLKTDLCWLMTKLLYTRYVFPSKVHGRCSAKAARFCHNRDL